MAQKLVDSVCSETASILDVFDLFMIVGEDDAELVIWSGMVLRRTPR